VTLIFVSAFYAFFMLLAPHSGWWHNNIAIDGLWGRVDARVTFVSILELFTAFDRAVFASETESVGKTVRCCEKLWGRILSCGPISNRPSCDIVPAVRGRLKIGLQDEILPHSEPGGSTKTAP